MTKGKHVAKQVHDPLEIEMISDVNYHLNPHLTLYFVLSGSLSIYKNGKIILLQSGNVYLVNQGEIVGLSGYEQNVTAVLRIKGSSYLLENNYFTVNKPLSLTYYSEVYQKLVRIFSRLIVENLRKKPGYELFMQGGVHSLIGLFYRYLPYDSQQTLPRSDGSEPEKLKEILNYIQAHYRDKLGLSELADLFFINKFYLAHLFKDHLGLSVGNYIQEVRLMNGVKMLETTKESVTEIALGNGFANVRAFNTAFKEKNGLTPIQYRKNQGEITPAGTAADSVTPKVYSLLTDYLSEAELTDLQLMEVTTIRREVDLERVIARRQASQFVLRRKPDNVTTELREICEPLGIRYVSLKHLFSREYLTISPTGIELNYPRLEQELGVILENRLLPYFQIQAADVDAFNEATGQPELFLPLLQELAYFLQSHYDDCRAWAIEFRCFYEDADNISLCDELVPGISFFNEILQIFVHFPSQPTTAHDYEGPLKDEIMTFDDRGLVKGMPLAEALAELYHGKYLEVIKASKNIFYQDKMLASVSEFENDGYYEQFFNLSQAHLVPWFYLKQIDYRQTHIWPLSLDGESLFHYYPAELADKSRLQTEHPLLSEQWYALSFLKQLYGDVVFQDDNFIVTKSRENYRIIATYGQSEQMEKIMQEAENASEAFVFSKITVPFLQLALTLKNIRGRYKITVQELTPDVQKLRHELNDLGNSQKLSLADKGHFKDLNRPSRRLQELEIHGDYPLKLTVPLYGMILFELEKIG